MTKRHEGIGDPPAGWRGTHATVLGIAAIIAAGCATSGAPVKHLAEPAVVTSSTMDHISAVEALAQEARPFVHFTPDLRVSFTAEIKREYEEVEPRGCEAETHRGMLYNGAPLASMMKLVKTEQDCADDQIKCFNDCYAKQLPYPNDHIKKGTGAHYRYCQTECLKKFHKCLKDNGLVKRFEVMDDALAWLKSHGKEVLGTLVTVGAVTYIVVTSGAILVLATL